MAAEKTRLNAVCNRNIEYDQCAKCYSVYLLNYPSSPQATNCIFCAIDSIPFACDEPLFANNNTKTPVRSWVYGSLKYYHIKRFAATVEAALRIWSIITTNIAERQLTSWTIYMTVTLGKPSSSKIMTHHFSSMIPLKTAKRYELALQSILIGLQSTAMSLVVHCTFQSWIFLVQSVTSHAISYWAFFLKEQRHRHLRSPKQFNH